MGTKPMSIYCHVLSKDEIVDGMVDRAFAEIEPSTDEDWLDALRQRCVSARAVLNRHPCVRPLDDGMLVLVIPHYAIAEYTSVGDSNKAPHPAPRRSAITRRSSGACPGVA